MARVRMTGLASGLDTESMVKELVNASSTKVNKAKQDKQKAEWKQEAWQDLNTKLYNFYKTDLYNFRSAATYNKKSATASDSSKVSVSAGNGATAGIHSVSVKQIASSAYLTGANIKAAGKTFTVGEGEDEKTFTSADITGGTKLKDLGIAEGTSFFVNDREFVIDEKTTINDFAKGLSELGVSASFDANQGRFYINSSKTGEANNFTISSSDSEALEILGLGSGATKVDAQDAIIDYNGVEYRNASNQFSINGMNITAKAVTGNYNKETGEFTNDSPISITVANDTEGIYNSIKNFVKKYNELIDEMNKLYNEKNEGYDPLTDDERDALSDNQIEKWEEKAKVGLLRRDSTIGSLLSNMRTILSKGITVTNDDGSTSQYTLASLGIVTSSDWTENGKLHILGDEDDAAYASETNKLKAMLDSKPEIFSKVFADGDNGSDGIGKQMYDYMMKAMKKTETSSSLTFYDDVTLKDDIDDYDDKIEELNKKLSDMEDKYYDQFAKMESAMAKLQQQQSYLASLMGTA